MIGLVLQGGNTCVPSKKIIKMGLVIVPAGIAKDAHIFYRGQLLKLFKIILKFDRIYKLFRGDAYLLTELALQLSFCYRQHIQKVFNINNAFVLMDNTYRLVNYVMPVAGCGYFFQ